MSSSQECASPWASLLQNEDNSLVLTALAVLSTTLLLMKFKDWHVAYQLKLFMEYLFISVPKIQVEMTAAESDDDGIDSKPSLVVDIKDPKQPNVIQCFDPSTKQKLGNVKAMTPEEVHELCVKAAAAQKKWVQTSYAQRRQVLRTIQKYILLHIDDICRVSTRDSGKPKVDALLGEVLTTCEKIRCTNSNGELWLQKDYRPTGPVLMHKHAYVEYVPLGVLGVIAPWNYPFHNMLNHIISGIFAGNAVVGKVSEHTSWSSAYFGRIVQAALTANGHDSNLVQTVTGFGDAGAALVADPLVAKIIFTGSPAVGRHVMRGAAPFLKPVILELGGKDPMVLVDDIKIADIVPWAMRGAFQNCGQNCCGIERIYAYESIYDDFIKAVLPRIQALRQDIPLATCGSDGKVDCGAMVMDGQMDIVQELIDDAVKKGATLHAGGKRNAKLKGQFYEPTLISGITSDMRIAKEEVFGPVMCVVKVPKDDDEVCVKMVNDCAFGLGCCVYGGSQARAERIGKQLKSGMCTINDFGVNYLIQALPFGGVGESGFGRFAGPEGLKACCVERAVVVDKIPGVRTSIPKPLDYPMTPKSMKFGSALLHFFYCEGLWGKITGIVGLIKHG